MDGFDTNSQFAYLDHLSTEELEDILRADMEVSEGDTDLALYIMEVITKREDATSEESGNRTLKALQEFRAVYNTPEGVGQTLYPPVPQQAEILQTVVDRPNLSMTPRSNWHRLCRSLATAAAAAVIVVLLIPSALGYESFYQMIGVWTDSIFQFQSNGDPPSVKNYKSTEQALSDNSIPSWIVPSEIPEGFELEEVKIFEQSQFTLFEILTLYKKSDLSLTISVRRSDNLESAKFEKYGVAVQEYISNGIVYYLFENQDQNVAAWTVNDWECSIYGDVSIEDLKIMVDSIKER